jgi:two-component system sensor histidine kinase KdpD
MLLRVEIHHGSRDQIWGGAAARAASPGAALPGRRFSATPRPTGWRYTGYVNKERPAPSPSSSTATPRWIQTGYLQAVAAVVAATGLSWVMFPFFELANLIMTYLLVIVAIAARYGRNPSVLASVASVVTFDFFFVPPYLTFAVAESHSQYVLTFGVMLIVGVVISGLTARIHLQAEAARQREQRTAALYAMSRELAQTGPVEDLVRVAARHIEEVFEAQVTALLPNADGELQAIQREGNSAVEPEDATLSRWVFEHAEPAGLGTATPALNHAVYLPLPGHGRPCGVVSIRPRRHDAFTQPDALRQLETFVNQTALAVERARLAEEAQEARVRAETERLRNSLLTSVSHDLRTPLATITGAATTILESGSQLDQPTQQELLESIRDEADRLNRLVQNLLEMTRLESGALQLRRDWHPLEEVVGAALGRLAKSLGARRVTLNVSPDLPLVAIDDVLIEQVLVNLLDNAVKYTPPDSAIRVVVTATDRSVTVEVADGGPGLPRGQEGRVFEKFYRAAVDGRRGAGLGLAICRGIVLAHGGRIWAQNLVEGGAVFLFTLPLSGTAPTSVPTDA